MKRENKDYKKAVKLADKILYGFLDEDEKEKIYRCFEILR